MRAARVLLALALAVALALGAPAAANHPQQAGSRATSFDHKTGNEWWVEVVVGGSPSKVEARDDGGPWVALEKKSWGAWAKSFHIEPGHRVQFRASWSDGASVESCWFTHPAGVEQCTSTPPPPPPPSNNTTGTFAFAHGGGNEWWVEAKVSPRPAAVEAMDTGGAWVPLSLKSWGEWAASFRIEPGHDVKFRARSSSASAWEESCWFAHPSGALRPCGSTPPPPQTWPREGSYVRYAIQDEESWPTGRDWYEINVTVRYLNGAWQEDVEGWSYLELDDELRSKERIRYTAAAAGPRYAEAPPEAEPSNHTTKKNGVTIVAPALQWGGPNDPECPCGEWHIVAHEETDLQLVYSRGGRMSHYSVVLKDTDAPIARGDPAPTPPPPAAWPAEGSFVTFDVHEWSEWEDAPYDLYYNATFRFEDGAWSVRCVGTWYHHQGEWQNATVEPFESTAEWGTPAPPIAPTRISNGTVVQFERLSQCHTSHASHYGESILARSWLRVATNQSGEPFTARVWYADENATQDAAGDDYDAWWDIDTRLVLRWEYLPATPYGRSMGNLTDTDAPLRRA